MPNKLQRRVSKCGVVAVLAVVISAHFKSNEGKPIDPATGQSTSEKGMVTRVVKDLVCPLSGFNHVVYMNNYLPVLP